MAKRSIFDFNTWATLAQQDPERFEALRHRLLAEFIEHAPEHFRPRLSGLQFRIDMERRRAKTPLAACIRISQLMMEKLRGEFLPLLKLEPDAFEEYRRRRSGRCAKVLPLPRQGHG